MACRSHLPVEHRATAGRGGEVLPGFRRSDKEGQEGCTAKLKEEEKKFEGKGVLLH